MTNVYITLDYELFMGESGTPEKCLIEPMNHLTAMLDRYGVKVNVFVDVAYLLRMQQLKVEHPQLQRDFETVTNHIKQLDSEGHAIQLHLHPQWCRSTFDGKKWTLDKVHYKLSDLPLAEQEQLIHDGVTLLNSLTTRKVKAFRAGGYCADNFPELYETFLAEGIMSDTSVLRGEHSTVAYKRYDYRRVPKKTSYRIAGDVTREVPAGRMMEYPISTIVVPSFVYLANKHLNGGGNFQYSHISKAKWGDGQGLGYTGSKLQTFLTRVGMFFGKKSIRAAIELADNLEKVYRYSVRHYEGNDFVIIGHPKAISPYHIAVLEYFIKNHTEIKYKLL